MSISYLPAHEVRHPARLMRRNTGSPALSMRATLAPRDPRPLGKILLEQGAVESGDLLKAVMIRQQQNIRLGQILLDRGWVTPRALQHALSIQWRTTQLNPSETPGDPRLIDAAGVAFCLSHTILPWRRIGGVTWVATAHPDEFAHVSTLLPARFGTVRMLLCDEDRIREEILARRRIALIREAEICVPEPESCRTRSQQSGGQAALVIMAVIALGLWLVPVGMLGALTLWAILTLLAQTALKVASALTTRRLRRRAADLPQAASYDTPLPVISVMVPLFRESDIAGKLVTRLSRLAYPRELTDILLVIEEDDDVTRKALENARLPRWMRVVQVPDGPIKTKPRALNYALNFCRGPIVGVWDAEDRPDPDQLHKVARRFQVAPPDVACLQGALDYYNPRSNWLARCFTIEYATWFRVLLPGIAAMGLVVPLGGTTIFFRRAPLEAVGAWDAWNVTEDADLGVRLARRGWRTEIIDTTTDEEANCRAIPWIKQRSRWLKGYAMTWGVHMRQPLLLWRELGTKRFVAFQIQFFGSLSQYLLAPILWSFWLLMVGLPHPLGPMMNQWAGGHILTMLLVVFVLSEAISLVVGLWAVRGEKHRHLMAWVPGMHFYFPLGCLAGWKAIYEVVVKPFYWDKTVHGIYDASEAAAQPDPVATREPFPALPGSMPVQILGQIGGNDLSDKARQGQLEVTAPECPAPEADLAGRRQSGG